MENQQENRSRHYQMREKRSGGSFLGIILIIIGLLWLLKEIGWHVGFPDWGTVRDSTSGFRNIFHFGAWAVSWPVVLLVVGVLLIAGRRLIGALLVFLALFLFLPGIIIPGILAILFLPVILIVVGIILISRLL